MSQYVIAGSIASAARIGVVLWLAACARVEGAEHDSAADTLGVTQNALAADTHEDWTPAMENAGDSAVATHDVAGAAAHVAHGNAGPFIDTTAIPSGDPGASDVRIRSTSERPAQSDGTGAFRTSCNFSHMNFDDPMVFPGVPGASHLHAYFGNTAVDAASTATSIETSGNSTCRGGIANRTAYWVPALLDAQGVPQKPLQAQMYYKTGYHGVPAKQVVAFPSGLRMIAGDAKANAPQRIAYWRCDHDVSGHSAGIPSCGGRPITMVVEFPQCWDGEHLDSDDHKSHMAYADGGCPASHPIAIPAITFNIPYAVPASGTEGWRLASDSYDASLPGGLSAHGDWFDGWDAGVVAAWVANCDNAALDCHSHLLGDGRAIFY